MASEPAAGTQPGASRYVRPYGSMGLNGRERYLTRSSLRTHLGRAPQFKVAGADQQGTSIDSDETPLASGLARGAGASVDRRPHDRPASKPRAWAVSATRWLPRGSSGQPASARRAPS